MNLRCPLMLVVCLTAAACGSGSGAPGGAGGSLVGTGGTGGDVSPGGSGGGGTGGTECTGEGDACQVDDPCKLGAISCDTGTATCVAAANVADGTPCGEDQVCVAGSCAACVEGATCESPNECKNAVMDCTGPTTGGPECVPTRNRTDGTQCTDGVCKNGTCVAGNTITVEAGEGAQVPISGELVLTLRLVDQEGVALPSRRIDVTLPTGGVSNFGMTGSDGRVTIAVRVGRALGSFTLTASAQGTQNKVVPYTTVRPPAGTISTLVNGSFIRGGQPVSGPGYAAQIAVPYSLTARSDGTLYFADDNCHIYSLSPEGVIARMAGAGCGYSGDGSDAKNAWIGSNTRGLVLDEANDILYLSDMDAHVVRSIDLHTGIIRTVAGGGTAGEPAYGAGGQALAASLGNPMHLDLHDGMLYIADSERSRIWKLNLANGIIDTWLDDRGITVDNSYTPARVDCGPTGFSFSQCDAHAGCSVEWEPDGDAIVSGIFCWDPDLVAGPTEAYTYAAIGRVTQAGVEPVVVGSTTQRPDPESEFVRPPFLALGPSQEIYAADPIGSMVRRIVGEDQVVEIAGTIVAPGSGGDGGPSTAAGVSFPAELIRIGDDLYIADGFNNSIRVVWDAVGAYGP